MAFVNQTFSMGEVLTAAKMTQMMANDQALKDDVDPLKAAAGVFGKWGLPANQTVASATFVLLNASSSIGSILGGLTNASGGVTVPAGAGGRYEVHAMVRFPSGAKGARAGVIMTRNAGSISGGGVIAAGGENIGSMLVGLPSSETSIDLRSEPFLANAGDVLRVFVYHEGGADLTFPPGDVAHYVGRTTFTVQRVA